MKRKYYMHTIEGSPGGFDGEQICYASKGKCYWNAQLVNDLKTIRRQQKKTIEFRKKFGEDLDKYQTKYDYVIVCIGGENGS